MIVVCYGTGCQATGSVEVIEALKKAVEEAGWEAKVVPSFKNTGCHGFCSRGPLVVIQPQDCSTSGSRPPTPPTSSDLP